MFNSWRMGIVGATLRGMSQRDHASGLLAYVTGSHFIARGLSADRLQYGGDQNPGMSHDISGYLGSQDPVNCHITPGGGFALLESGEHHLVVDLNDKSIEVFEPGEHDIAIDRWFRFRAEERSRSIRIAENDGMIAIVNNGRLFIRRNEWNLDIEDDGPCLNIERVLGPKLPVLALSPSGERIALSTGTGIVLQINLETQEVISLTKDRTPCRALNLWFDANEQLIFAADPTSECWHRFPVQSVAVAAS